MPSLLVHIRQEVPDMGLLPLVASAEGLGEMHGDGSFPGSGYHHMHRAEHPLHGPGALPHDRRVQHHAFSGQSGKGFLTIGLGRFPAWHTLSLKCCWVSSGEG